MSDSSFFVILKRLFFFIFYPFFLTNELPKAFHFFKK